MTSNTSKRRPWLISLIVAVLLVAVGWLGLAPADREGPVPAIASTSMTDVDASDDAGAARDGAVAASTDPGDYLQRAHAQTSKRDDVAVSASALLDSESLAMFGHPLAKHGVQPVWVEIANQSKLPYWFMPVFMDRDFYTAREVARLFHSDTHHEADTAFENKLVAHEIKMHVAPGETVSGFVYTTLTRGIKLINVDLLGPKRLLSFDFTSQVDGGRFDFERHASIKPYGSDQHVSISGDELGSKLAQLPCCTVNHKNDRQGDPLNLIVVGSEREILVAMVRAGWGFTETIDVASVEHMARAFVFGSAYNTSPVSALYYDDRPQDFAMQRARKHISQRNHLRLWQTAFRVGAQPVWVGQISRDIGVKLTAHAKTLTTHVIDPNVDAARDYLMQDMLMSGDIARWGYVGGVGAVPEAAPRKNLGGDPYYTDGQRLVIFIANKKRSIDEAEYLQWPAH